MRIIFFKISKIMKKIISIIIWFFILFTIVKANQSVVVSAVVWNQNHAPVILSVSPNSNPRILEKDKIQLYTIYFRDDEKEEVTYTITPDNWFSNPINGTIVPTDYDSGSWAYINFMYLAPSIPTPNEFITVTINDNSNVIFKKLNLYIY